MTKPTVTEEMVEAAKHAAWENGWPWTITQFPIEAAITAAIEASGLVEENARLREALVKIAKRDGYPVPSEIANEALNKEPTP